MKKILYTGLLLTLGLTVKAQIYTADGILSSNRTVTMSGRNLTFQPSTAGMGFFINGTNGNVGISNTSPTEKLHVNGNISADFGYFNKGVSDGANFGGSNPLRINSCMPLTVGKIVSPDTKTGVFSIFDFPISDFDTAPTVWLNLTDRANVSRLRVRAKQGAETQMFLFDKSQATSLYIVDDGNSNVTMTMPKANSRVCIGTSSFTDGTDVYALSVNGNVRADRVKVYTTWADYVFEKDYKLPTLAEVEQHIKEKGHLQDIPSAAEVEAKGIELGEMNKLLLQKIEELTLYMIEQNKTNEEQAKLIKELQGQVKDLTEKKLK